MVLICSSPVRCIKKGKKKKVNKKPSSYPGFRYTEGMIFTLVCIKLWLPSAYGALAAPGALLSLSWGGRGGEHWVSSPYGWLDPLLGSHQSAGYSQASASPAGSAARQAHREEGQRPAGFSIINYPREGFQRMVSESPLWMSFPQEKRREDTNHLQGMCLTDCRSPCC